MVWTAPRARETLQKGGARSPPPFARISGTPGAAQTSKMYNFRPAQKSTIAGRPVLEGLKSSQYVLPNYDLLSVPGQASRRTVVMHVPAHACGATIGPRVVAKQHGSCGDVVEEKRVGDFIVQKTEGSLPLSASLANGNLISRNFRQPPGAW